MSILIDFGGHNKFDGRSWGAFSSIGDASTKDLVAGGTGGSGYDQAIAARGRWGTIQVDVWSLGMQNLRISTPCTWSLLSHILWGTYSLGQPRNHSISRWVCIGISFSTWPCPSLRQECIHRRNFSIESKLPRDSTTFRESSYWAVELCRAGRGGTQERWCPLITVRKLAIETALWLMDE